MKTLVSVVCLNLSACVVQGPCITPILTPPPQPPNIRVLSGLVIGVLGCMGEEYFRLVGSVRWRDLDGIFPSCNHFLYKQPST